VRREAIDAGHLAYVHAMKSNDPQALGRLLAGDVVLMPPNQPAVAGTQAAIDWFGRFVKQARTVDATIIEWEVIVSGDIGIERGAYTWTIAPVAGGAPVQDRGHYVAIWQRQADGSWKIKRNIWNSSLPMPALA